MIELDLKIIELIKQNMSMKQISSLLNISEKQLYIRIKQIINHGYEIHNLYSYDSDIYYKIMHTEKADSSSINICLPHDTNTFKALVISDLHVGNYKSDLSLVNYVYEYATKEGISYIFICGDNIEGDYTTDRKTIKDVVGQIEMLIKKYPYDKNINNVMIFGNHDHYSLENNGLNIAAAIKNARYDIIPIGYGQGSVKIRKDSFILFHKLSGASVPTVKNNEKLILSGHGHMMKTKVREQFWICVPTLSYVSTDKTKDVIPSFVEMTIDFDKGKFDYIKTKHLMITDRVYEVSGSNCKIKSLPQIKL